jgi:hypothetical protein
MSSLHRVAAVVAVLAAMVCMATYAHGQGAWFTGVGFVPGVSQQSIPRGISGDGTVVVGDAGFSTGAVGFMWTQGGGIVSLGSTTNSAKAVSYDGSIIAGRLKGYRAYRWVSGSGITDLGYLPGGSAYAEIHDMTTDGSFMVGNGDTPAGNQACYWTQATGFVLLGDLPGGDFSSVARAVSNSGARIAGWSDSGAGSDPGIEGFYWMQSTGMVPLGFLPGTETDPTRETQVFGISASGSTIVGHSQTFSKREAFRWTQAGGMESLEAGVTLSGSSANDVSLDGQIVVGQAYPGGPGSYAFIWDPTNGIRDIEVVLAGLGINTGWQDFFWAGSISDDGQTIAGYGRNASGQQEGWVAFIPRTITDGDSDGVNDVVDNCPGDSNAMQDDIDGDGVGTLCDPCPAEPMDSCDPNGSDAAEVTVASGGTVQSPSGELTLDVPAGSLGSDTTISVTKLQSAGEDVDLVIGTREGRGRVVAKFDLQPDGLTFSPPATLTIVIDVSDLPSALRDTLDIYQRSDGGPFTALGATCNVVEGPPGTFIATCTVSISGFSEFAVIAEQTAYPVPAHSRIGLVVLILLLAMTGVLTLLSQRRA